ncbi:lipopolysaccharide biosynthesis protein [Psychrobium sp. 1_MG-2023]|uniref:lipopolysaccharide biosynthesis protein n=1 Tax=Psychrobium sp. 1_MG-2023 TaxID=3062624 RepID=UPI0027330DAC|nr:lipopolysaccharide biosynthesis protein [Psychrobium sp. 1_MG-2023]MDP2562110.1 lipopolysaccharide biosynthesis protein [Psychrobium sp. 1_MG-2023]
MRTPSLKKNVAFNYIGQLYVTFIGILILPIFLQYMGPEAYGLVGFFTLIQAWLSLLDVGMTPTLGREIARLKNKAEEHWRLLTVVNSLEITFTVIALIASITLFMAKDWIVSDWLTVETLNVDIVTTAISIMAIIIAVRWVASINRSGINAYEAQVWMNITDIIINTLRFPGALLLIIYADGDILAYFYFQLAVVLFEVSIIRFKMRSLLPSKNLENVKRFSLRELKRIAPFALSVGYTSAIWVLLTQLDKLLLSKYLTLSEYGYFTLVGVVVGGMTMLASPVTKALLPRMTGMLSDGKEQQMLLLYRTATRCVAAFIFPLGLVIAFNAEVVVYTWTGNKEAAAWVSPIMPVFVLGSMILAIMTFQYFLQYAHGELKYHVRWNTFSVLINVPLIVYAATYYGALGVGWVWFGFRLFSLIVWVAFIHHKFAPGIHIQWLLKDVLSPFLIAVAVIFCINSLYPLMVDMERLTLFFSLVTITIFTMLLTSSIALQYIIRRKLYA